jgi:hypothetical protein
MYYYVILPNIHSVLVGHRRPRTILYHDTILLSVSSSCSISRIVNAFCFHCSGCTCIIIIYDVTDKKSLENVPKWFTEISRYPPLQLFHSIVFAVQNSDTLLFHRYSNSSVVKIIAANKSDLTPEVDVEDGRKQAQALNCAFFETRQVVLSMCVLLNGRC